MDDNKTRFVDIKTFKEMAADKDTENLAIRKFMTLAKMDELSRNDDKLQLKFSITTADVDRDNDTIVVEGWDFTDYKKNPVVLWAHNYATPPVAKAVNIFRDNMSIDSTAEFTPKEMNPFGYMIYEMYKGGFLNAVSVGFQPTDYELARDRDGGMNFTRQSLMEYSAVPVPSNPNALIQARSKGINTEPLKNWAENMLDDWEHTGEGLLIPKNIIEIVRSESDPKQKTSVVVPVSIETTDEQPNSDKSQAETETKAETETETETEKNADPEIFLEWFEVITAMKALLGFEGKSLHQHTDEEGYAYLSKQYEFYDKTPPDFKYVESHILKHLPDDYFLNEETGQVQKLTDEIKTETEIKTFLENLEGISKDAKTDHVKSAMLEAINAFKDFKEGDCDCPEHDDEEHEHENIQPEPNAADVVLELEEETDGIEIEDDDDLPTDPKAIAAIVAKEVNRVMREITGKLD